MPKDIALVMRLEDRFEHGIARGVVRYAKSRPDWRLYGYGWMFESLRDFDQKGDGIISRVETAEEADRLAALGLPLVDVAGAFTRPGFRHVTNDDRETGYAAGLHLRGCGFERFAFLGVAGTIWSADRRRGFGEALGLGAPAARGEAASIPSFERGLAWWERSQDDHGALARFLSRLELPSALFGCNDTTALRATELANRLGIAIPDSLAVLGVDDEDIVCELAMPSLSSVKLDCESIGYRAAEVLDSILEGSGPEEGWRGTIRPSEVAERESTRVFSCSDPLVAKAATLIRARAHEGISVADVVAVLPCSRRALEIRFRQATGGSLHEAILKARLSRAKRLLRETDFTIERVAEASGFGALQRFHAAFKEAEGMSPGEWRRQG